MVTKRVYILNNNFNNNINGIYDITNFDIEKYKYKVSKVNKITKKSYLNINQEINQDTNVIHTYCEYFKVLQHIDNKIIMEHKKDILDDLEFPPLNKYDFEETYEEIEYHTIYGKLITNKYQTYLELNKDYEEYEKYNEIFNIF